MRSALKGDYHSSGRGFTTPGTRRYPSKHMNLQRPAPILALILSVAAGCDDTPVGVEEDPTCAEGLAAIPEGEPSTRTRPDTFTLRPGLAQRLPVLANDGHALDIQRMSEPCAGSARISGREIVYTATEGPESDFFWYYVGRDDLGVMDSALVRIDVLEPRDPSSYEVTFLGTLGGDSAEARDVNERGEVTGWSLTDEGALHPFLWDGSRMSDLGSPTGGRSGGVAISDAGAIAAHGFLPGSEWPPVAARWENGTWTVAPDSTGSRSFDIDDDGVVVGEKIGGGGVGFVWRDREFRVSNEGTFIGINDAGWMVASGLGTYGNIIVEHLDGRRISVVSLGGRGQRPTAIGEPITGPDDFRVAWIGSESPPCFGVWRDGLGTCFARERASVIDMTSEDLFLLHDLRLFLDGVFHDIRDLVDDSSVEILAIGGMNDRGDLVGQGRVSEEGPIGAILLTPGG